MPFKLQQFGESRVFEVDWIWILTGMLDMRKIVLALTAMAAFTGSAVAADLAARPYQGPSAGRGGCQLDRLLDFGRLRLWFVRVPALREILPRHLLS